MTGKEFQVAAMRTASSIKTTDLLLNGILGLNGEAGEVADLVKKSLFQGHDLDYEKLADELGDVLWYVAITAQGIGLDLDQIMAKNVHKLWQRYPDGFEAERSINRKV